MRIYASHLPYLVAALVLYGLCVRYAITLQRVERAKRCVHRVRCGLAAMKAGDLEVAEIWFLSARKHVRFLSNTVPNVYALSLLHLCLVWTRQSRTQEAAEIREQALAHLKPDARPIRKLIFQDLMAAALMDLEEYRHATPFCEMTKPLAAKGGRPLVLAGMLWRAGHCYNAIGMKENAVAPLRASLEILRKHPGDELLAAALVDLADAVRQSSPDEAIDHYKEAAKFYEAQGHMESAAVSWNNSATLCSEQGRLVGSLTYFEKALKIREQAPTRNPESIGSLLYDMGDCRRRLGEFKSAIALTQRAMDHFLAPGDGLAAAYGVLGRIYRDLEDDDRAVTWFRAAYDEHSRMPNPDLQAMATDLQQEIDAFKRLGQDEEVAAAKQRLIALRNNAQATSEASVEWTNSAASQTDAVQTELSML